MPMVAIAFWELWILMRFQLSLQWLANIAKPVVFLLRREPLYHKLQYSKSPKFDAAAAAFGVTIGAFGVYLGLSSLGSMGADLTDLTVCCWYLGLWISTGLQGLAIMRTRTSWGRFGLIVWVTLMLEIWWALLTSMRNVRTRHA